MRAKFGLVALLDALGARSVSIETAGTYLENIDKMRSEIDACIDLMLNADAELGIVENSDEVKKAHYALNPRFFGDTILMTYEIQDTAEFPSLFTQLAFVLNSVIIAALERGILFRGAVSVGQYIEREHVALGPAIADAASWYNAPDMVGVLCSPRTTNYLKASFARELGVDSLETRPVRMARMYDVPLRTGDSLRTYILDWANQAALAHAVADKLHPLTWFYNAIGKLDVPRGTESKYSNTEAYFKHCLATPATGDPLQS